jgi:hypothetical protein
MWRRSPFVNHLPLCSVCCERELLGQLVSLVCVGRRLNLDKSGFAHDGERSSLSGSARFKGE